MNPYYDHTTYPNPNAPGASAALRAELNLIEAGFDKLPTLSGNANKLVVVNAAGTGLEAVASLPNLEVIDSTFFIQDNGDATKRIQFQASGISTGTTRVLTVPDANLTIVGLDTIQTLTNKTLTAPTINTAVTVGGTINNAVIGGATPAAGTFTSLTASTATVGGSTVVTLAATQTLTNKTISGGTVAGAVVTGLPAPSSADDAATKGYVDGVAQGLDIKASVRAATTANITLSGTQTVDGVSVIAGERVLAKNQSTASENGIYVAAAGAWARATDMDVWAELPGAFFFVEEGTANDNSGWVCTVDQGGTLGVTSVTFEQFSGAGQITAGAGMTKTGNTLNVGTASTARIVVNTDNIDLATTGASAGTYRSVTVDVYGRVTAGTNPTTLAGYGITDAYTKTYIDTLYGSIASAATSAADALTYKNAAESAATTATTQAGIATTGAATATTQAGIATTQAGNAATAANNAEAAWDQFDDRYLGAKSSPPIVDNDGNALVTGALYFDTTLNLMRVYSTSNAWVTAGAAVNGTSSRQTYTATAGQTSFAITYDVGFVDVYLNGLKLEVGVEFTATNGTSVVLATGATAGDIVDMVAYGTFAVANAVAKTGDTMTGPLVIESSSTSNALRITNTGSGNSLLVEDSANPDSSPFVIDENGLVINGSTTKVDGDDAGGTNRISWGYQANGTAVGNSGYLATYWRNDNTGAGGLSIGKSRGSAVGTRAIVLSNDELGQIGFIGDDGTNFIAAAGIFAYVDGTPDTNAMPGRLVFSTTADGGSAPTERMRINSAGDVGIGVTPSYKLHVSGDIYATGNVTAYSDRRLKDNIETLTGALAVVELLRGVSYTRKDTGEKQVGVIAQEIELVLPEVVVCKDDVYGVAYGNITAVLIEAVKELSARVKELESK